MKAKSTVTEEEEKVETTTKAETHTGQPVRKSLRGVALTALGLIVVLGVFIAVGLHRRTASEKTLAQETSASAVSTVTVVHPAVANSAEEVVLPGNMQAFTETPVWARASGYLRKWYVDIGTRVKRGQLLAEIEAPEIDHQLQQAREQMATEQENLKLAQITAERYQNLLKQDSVSRQDVDTAVQTQAARLATFKSAQANVARLEQMVSYEKVYAPFDGVVTARNTDIGALIDAGANAPGKELFRLASTNTLRVYVNVPETYSQAAKPGVSAYVTLNEFPGRRFAGRVVRNADAIDVASRTLLVEVDVPNPTGELLPGSYTSVHLKLTSKVPAVTIPANTLLFRSEGLQVATVKDNRVVLKPIIIGHDYGDHVEVLRGLDAGDSLIVNPSDSIANGEQVQVSTTGRQEGQE
jgi:RND family efflux transporter MFP subunit